MEDVRRLARGLDGRQQEGDEQTHDGEDDQHLDQGEAAADRRARGPGSPHHPIRSVPSPVQAAAMIGVHGGPISHAWPWSWSCRPPQWTNAKALHPLTPGKSGHLRISALSSGPRGTVMSKRRSMNQSLEVELLHLASSAEVLLDPVFEAQSERATVAGSITTTVGRMRPDGPRFVTRSARRSPEASSSGNVS